MLDVESLLYKYTYSKFKTPNIKTYVLLGFYDILINNKIYFKVNMLSIYNDKLHIYRMATCVFSINMEEIKEFSINYDYRKLNFKLIRS
jgi:hypothetical protein